MNDASKTFKENYTTLRRIADQLQRQDEPDIDALVPMVEEAMEAYKACKERLAAVKALLEEKLPADLAGTGDLESVERSAGSA